MADSSTKCSSRLHEIVGHSNESLIEIDGQSCRALLDTGSNVSTISHSSYTELLGDKPLQPLDKLALDIEGAGGQKLPYSGYIEVDVGVPGLCNPISCLLLVVPDTRYAKTVPIILGTNVLNLVMKATEGQYGIRFQQTASLAEPWHFVFRCMKLQSQEIQRSKGRLCIIKCALANKLIIHGNRTVTIQGKIDKKSTSTGNLGITQTWSESTLPCGVEITPTLLNMTHNTGTVPIQISNLTGGPIVVCPNSALCQVQSCELELQAPDCEVSTDTSHSMSDQIDLDSAILSPDQKLEVQSLIEEWSDVFSANDLDIGLTSLVKHSIRLDDEQPFKQRHRKIAPAMYKEVRLHLQELLEAGVIRKSRSPWASNIVLVRKKDQSLRLCVDFRQLNKRTVKDAYALPRIEDILEGLGGSKYYSVLDMKSGYYQVEVTEECKPMTAFTVGPLGFFEYNRLAFGLSNAPATYQRLMEDCLGDLNAGEHKICQIYLDDVIVVSKTYSEHIDRLKQVFNRFRQAGMKLSPQKCHLFRDKVRYVGHIVSSDGIATDPEKTSKIAQWPEPRNCDELRTFLGFTGYYRRYVRDFSKIAKPLNDLTVGTCHKKKSRKKTNLGQTLSGEHSWNWSEPQQHAFDKLKQLLVSPPILAYPEYGKPFILHTDASGFGLGAVLYQEIEGKKRVIAYASRGLSSSEKNYPVHKLEFLALKWAVTKKFHDYLYGTTFVIYTDNNPLTYILANAKLDATGHRWVASLAVYDFTIKYKPGKTNNDADGLSRMPQSDGEYDFISRDTIRAICHQHSTSRYVESISMSANAVDCFDLNSEISPRDWRSHQMQDTDISVVARAVTNKRKLTSRDILSKEGKLLLKEFNRLVVRRGVLYRHVQDKGEDRYQLVLPKSFRSVAMKGAHNDIGHLGRNRSITILRERVYWPGMNTDLEEWISHCERCIKSKTPTNSRAPLVSISTSQPLELVCMDYLSLEMSKGGFQNILVLTDHFTKYAVALPTKNQTARTTAEVIFNSFISHYGFPKRIHSDQGANFESKMIKELCSLSGMSKSRTIPYHPCGNGITERLNRTLLGMLGTLDPDKKHNWKSEVGPLVHAYNCTKHESTGYSPYMLMFGRQPRLALDVVLGLVNSHPSDKSHGTYVSDLKKSLAASYELASSKTKLAQQRQKKGYDLRCRGAVVECGDRVLVKIVAFDGKHKISDKWENDPYIVLDQPNPEVPVYVGKQQEGDC